jgi:hypothetical protein
MHTTCYYGFNAIQSNVERVAKLNVKVTIARNIINFSIATVDLLSHISRFKFTVIPLRTHLKTAKDISAMFVFTVTAAEILTPGFWNRTKTSFAKKGNRFCKLVYSGLETFWIVPSKWKQLSSPPSVLLCKDIFVIASAGFGIWYASEEIHEANRVIKKNEGRLSNLGWIPGKSTNSDDFRKGVNYKIKKACIKIDLNRRHVTKVNLIRAFEITKIVLVALQILLTSGLVAASSSVIGTGIFAASLAIGSISLALTIYDIFYWKNPKQGVYPTTNLTNT